MTETPAPNQPTPRVSSQKVPLRLLTLAPDVTEDQLEEIGKDYVEKHFSLSDGTGRPSAFCETEDGIPVFFRGTCYHILRKNKGGLVREIDRPRVERIHWIIPILSGQAETTVLRKDGMGEDLGGKFRRGVRYRVYWAPKFSHLVILTFDKENKALSFNTAYQVTEGSTRSHMKRLFPR